MQRPSLQRAARRLPNMSMALRGAAARDRRLSPGISSRVLVVVGSSASAIGMLTEGLGARRSSRHVLGIVAPEANAGSLLWPHLGPLDDLAHVLDSNRVSEVALCLEASQRRLTHSVVQECSRRGITVWIPIPDRFDDGASGLTRLRHAVGTVVKRSMDLLGAVAGLALFAPILLGAGLAILVTDGRPIFFRQQRAGLNGRAFRIVKFRTMQRDADALRDSLRDRNEIDGQAAFKLSDDPRVTGIGRWLRRTSIDELPQLWNVLRGDMSLVGPRPHPYDDLAGYEPWHFERLAVKPGLTGLWQVELRNEPDFDRCVRKDLEYIARASVWLDLKLILQTIPVLLRGTGR